MEQNNRSMIEEQVRKIIEEIDKDPNREGLKDTPKRYIKFLKEFTNPPDFKFTTFDSEGYNEMIIQQNIPFYSLCEHHIAPFFGYATIAYIPDKKIVGLSKLARTLDHFSRRLQNQERITQQVAEELQNQLQPQGVAVIIKAKHLCMEMRGVKKHDTWTTTSKMVGAFGEEGDHKTRDELLSLIKT